MISQQAPVAVGGVINPSPPPLFLIEIEESVFKKLRALATKEGIDINRLGSELIKRLLMLHRTEVQRVVDQLRRNNHCPDR